MQKVPYTQFCHTPLWGKHGRCHVLSSMKPCGENLSTVISVHRNKSVGKPTWSVRGKYHTLNSVNHQCWETICQLTSIFSKFEMFENACASDEESAPFLTWWNSLMGNHLSNNFLFHYVRSVWKSMWGLHRKCQILTSVKTQGGETMFQLTACFQ